MIRLDKFLCDYGIGTRSQVKEFIKKGQIQVNDQVVKKPDFKLVEEKDSVFYQGKELAYQSFYYYMLHKPMGVITATEDKREKTVMDLMGSDRKKNLFPVGRLDKDTEGLLLITDNGELAHQLLSPKKNVPKTYYVETAEAISEEMITMLTQGVDIGEKEATKPALVEILTPTSLHLTITEGKFHQVKRRRQM